MNSIFKTKPVFFIGMLICCLLSSGCIFIIAGVGAFGGYAISRDTIQGESDKNFDSMWSSSLKVLNILGNVDTEDRKKGVLEASIDSSKAKVIIEQLTPKTVRMRVSARKYMMPNITLAQKIYIKVIQNAK